MNRNYQNKSERCAEIFPRHETKNLDLCKNLYTKCDYRLEKYAHEIALKLEDKFKALHILFEDEMKMQNKLVDEMWINSQKYLLIKGYGVYIKPYPEVVSNNIEKLTLNIFCSNLKKIQDSNRCLKMSFKEIRTAVTELTLWCNTLDSSVDSPFIKGTYYMKPVKYMRSQIVDVYNYCHQYLYELLYWASLLEPSNSNAIEYYSALTKSRK